MPGKRDGEITRLLGAFSNGEPEAEARLMELTYRELRKIAAGHMRRERSARSLQTTDLVHEAYLRLVEQADTPWRDRAHFFQVAAHVMRQVLIDRARKRHAGKRGGGVPEISLDRALDIAEAYSGDLLVLEDAQVPGHSRSVLRGPARSRRRAGAIAEAGWPPVPGGRDAILRRHVRGDRKSTRLNS